MSAEDPPSGEAGDRPPGDDPNRPPGSDPNRSPGNDQSPPAGKEPDRSAFDGLGALRPLGPDGAPARPVSRASAEPLAGELNPDAAILEGEAYQRPPRPPLVVIDTRKYQRMVAGFGLLLVLALSIYLFAKGGGSGTAGISPGQRLPKFVAPLAISNLAQVDVNAHPICNPLRPSLRGLNVCDRQPLVLAMFVLGYKPCVQQVDTLQTLAARFPHIQFAAVAVGGDKASTADLVRQHHWTIPVAYDVAGTIAQVYGVEVCPLIEIVKAGGVVQQRLIGKHWLSVKSLTRAVEKLPS